MDSGTVSGAEGPRVTDPDGSKEPVTEYHHQVDAFKKDLLQTTLEVHRGNRTHAAQFLGLSRSALLYRMQKYNLVQPQRRGPDHPEPS